MSIVIAAVVGAVLGYAFRGYISRTKTSAGAAIAADVKKEVSKL